MAHLLSLEHTTLIDVTPPELLRIAAACECPLVCMRINPGDDSLGHSYNYLTDLPMQRETRRLMRDLGIAVPSVLSFHLGEHTAPDEFDRGFAAAAELGATIANIHGDIADQSHMQDAFARMAERAAPYGLVIGLEWFFRSKVNTLAKAIAIQDAAPGTVLVADTLHIVRTGTTLADLAAAHDRITWIQLNDAPLEVTPEYIETEGRFNRLIPGEGELPLREILAVLPENVPLGVEVPNRAARAAGVSAEDWAKRAVAAARRLCGEWGITLQTL